MSRIEKIRMAVLLASGDMRLEEIAAQWGCARSTISTLLSEKRMGSKLQERAEAWLRERGYWPDDVFVARESDSPYSPRVVPLDVRCPECREMTPDAGFCMHCGAALKAQCPKCAMMNAQGVQYCGGCGSLLQATSVVEPNDEPKQRRKGA